MRFNRIRCSNTCTSTVRLSCIRRATASSDKSSIFFCFSVFVCEILIKIELVHDFFCKRSYRLWLYRSPNYGISTTINDIAHASTIYRICEQHRVNILFLNHTFGLCIILTWYAAAADKNYNGIFASKVFCFPSETTLLISLQIA